MTEKIFHYVERAIVLALMVMMLVVVALSTVELAVTLVSEIMPTGEKAVLTDSGVRNGVSEFGSSAPGSAGSSNGGDDDAYNNPALFLDIDELLTYFGLFFMILIGLELLETIKMYLKEDQIHVEVVMLVAMSRTFIKARALRAAVCPSSDTEADLRATALDSIRRAQDVLKEAGYFAVDW